MGMPYHQPPACPILSRVRHCGSLSEGARHRMASKAGSKASSGQGAAAKKGGTKKPKGKQSGKGKGAQAAPLFPVREDEKPWTTAEIEELRQELENDVRRALNDLKTAEEDLQGLIWDAGDGSGDDQADAGAKTYEREQELSLANISRDKLEQVLHALDRLADGTYGVCEICGQAIGKFRLQAAPRATLCRSCKEKTERG